VVTRGEASIPTKPATAAKAIPTAAPSMSNMAAYAENVRPPARVTNAAVTRIPRCVSHASQVGRKCHGR
jgi:hypothetical protein